MPRPNILLFFTDQQRYDTVACTHSDPAIRASLKTPNLDRLCAEGIRYERSYTPNPVCIPARYNMITGLPARYHGHSDNSGSPLPQGIPCLAELLSNAGYSTHAVGKMHFMPPREHHGFHRMELMEETPHHRADDDYLRYLDAVGCRVMHQHGVRHFLYHQPQRAQMPEEHHGSKWVADRAIDYLRRTAGRDRPFFLKASWIHPHPPQHIPERLADMYVGAPLPPRIERVDAPSDRSDLPPKSRNSFQLGEGFFEHPERLRRHMEHYHASVSFVDEQMGRVLETLDELGLADNTLVLATSDHGEMLGDHDCLQKASPFESAVHVPFIMRFPGTIEPGTVDRDQFVDLNDVMPTFLDAADVEYPGPHELPGSSLLSSGGKRDRSVQYIENSCGPKRWVSLRNAQYKYVHSYYGWEALYDMEKDPLEQHNLLADGVPSECAGVREDLRRQLVEYEERWGLPGNVFWKDMMKFQQYPLPTGPKARNSQLPPWINNLTPEERAEYGALWDEVLAAIEKEPLVKLSEMDVDAWAARCGVPQEFVERVKREGR